MVRDPLPDDPGRLCLELLRTLRIVLQGIDELCRHDSGAIRLSELLPDLHAFLGDVPQSLGPSDVAHGLRGDEVPLDARSIEEIKRHHRRRSLREFEAFESKFSDDEWVAIQLYYGKGLKQNKIAKVVGAAESTISKRLSESEERLRTLESEQDVKFLEFTRNLARRAE